MKGLIVNRLCLAGGFCAVLSLGAAHLFAEDVQWRSASSPGAAGAAAPVKLVTLSRPIPASETEAAAPPAVVPAFRPVLGKPMPVARGKVDDEPKPLPPGPILKTQNGKQEPGTLDGPKPEIKEPAKPKFDTVKPKPMPGAPEYIPHMPSPVKTTPSPVWDTFYGEGPLYGDGAYSGGPCFCGPCCSAPLCTDGCDFGDPWGCCDCPDRGKIWFSGAYLLWAFKAKNAPPLVTLSPLGTAKADSGVLGKPTTLVVYDKNSLEDETHNGARFHVGVWLDRFPCTGLEWDYFFLGRRSKSDTFGSNGNPQYSRPIINGQTGKEEAQLVSFPGPVPILVGSVRVDTFSEMWGLEMNARHKMWCTPISWLDFFWGYRHVQLNEGITIFEDLHRLDTAPNQDITVRDQFFTRNIFNGPQVGFQGEYHFWNRWFVQGTLKLAVGNMHERITIRGQTTLTAPPGGTTQVANSGILAGSTNVGVHQADRFVVVPEIGLKLGYELTDHWRIWAGYDFLYISNVVRPGDQIDRTINPTLVPFSGAAPNPNPPRPAVLFRSTDFWAQGVNFGMEYRW